MDNSILSIASIASEVAEEETQPLEETTATATSSSTTVTATGVSGAVVLDDIAPPTLMEEVSGCLTSKTLVLDDERVVQARKERRDSQDTYTIEGAPGQQVGDMALQNISSELHRSNAIYKIKIGRPLDMPGHH